MDEQNQPTVSPHVTFATRPDGSTYLIPRFQWGIDREQAAADIAEGQYSLAEISRRAGVSAGALAAWRQHPEFRARVEERQKQFRELVMSYGLARKEARLNHLQDRHDRLSRVIQARGKAFETDEKLCHVAGGDTGYVYQKVTAFGVDYLVDTKTAALLGDIEKQAAIEVGEWQEAAAPGVAVQIVVPHSMPDASKAPVITIGSR